MRVAYVTFAPFVSGAERSLQVMLQEAPSVGIDPMVLCPPGSQLIPWCEENNIRYHAVPLPDRDKWHAIRWFSSVLRVARILRDEHVEVVHSNQVWSFATVGAAARLLGIPRLCHMRDEVGVEGTRWWCKSGVEGVICISQHIERIVASAWAREKRRPRIQTLLNPVMVTAVDPVSSPPDLFSGPNRRKTDRPHRFGVGEHDIVFGFIGQIIAVKGVLELLEAAAGLPRALKWNLLIAGRDPHPGRPYEQRCRQRVEELGLTDRVIFLGFIENVREFFNSIDVAVVPSLEEPLGRIPLEAASYGRASIAFATGGLPETIVDGVTGWLVPTGDVDGLRDAMIRVLACPEKAEQMGADARRRVLTECDPNTYMRQVSALYRELIAAKRKGTGAVRPGKDAASRRTEVSTR